MIKNIEVKGAREHNLKNVDLTLPRDQMIVFSGVSGSGKTTLAFDTIYAEGQRRYMESLSSYARQFLGNAQKPKVESIEGLSPAISIEQKTTNKNPRSTVGTVTEIYDYFRLLYARIGTPHCPKCGREITSQSIDQIIDQIMELPEGTKFQVLAPVVRGEKGEHKRLLERLRREGYARVIVDGELYDLSEDIKLKKTYKHSISVVIDRLKAKDTIRKRLTDSVETALKLTDGLVECDVIGGETKLFSENLSCPDCNISMPKLEPRSFSFNNPFGMCPDCNGLGFHMSVDPKLIIPDENLSIDEGAIKFASNRYDYGYFQDAVEDICHHYNFSVYKPIKEAPEGLVHDILYGTDEYEAGRDGYWEGSINRMNRRYHATDYPHVREKIEKYMKNQVCETCHGKKLNPNALAVTVGGKNIMDLTDLSVHNLQIFFDNLKLTETQEKIGEMLLQEIKVRLKFLKDVGLDYLTLSRSAATLSGGESQRIKLSSQLSSKLMGVLYVLDEPSIGLHQRDNRKLLKTLRDLTDLGNTLIIVEHDEETLEEADFLVDVGPGAGEHGGQIVAAGNLETIKNTPESLTGQYLSKKKYIPIPDHRREGNGKSILVRGAKANNLKNIDVEFPLGKFIAVVGVSGSGKSTLVNEILYKALAKKLYRSNAEPAEHESIEGIGNIDKVISIDQSPIGRTPRSNPATYTKVFDMIRDLFARTPEAKARGYDKGRFSFNVKGGRCEACKGDGIKTIEMNFLPDVEVACEVCGGARYNRETLEVRYKGKNIAEVLDMTVDEACEFFENIPRIKRILQTLVDVGLGYVRLGQPSTQLSGGEAQRVKLASELCKINTGGTLYILDEPTTGLHMDDVKRLVKVLHRLVDQGSTVVVIEHNIDLIKSADWLIEMGPEGGDAGGQMIAAGTPEDLAKIEDSPTGPYVKKALEEGVIVPVDQLQEENDVLEEKDDAQVAEVEIIED